jgi:hypothetical protein
LKLLSSLALWVDFKIALQCTCTHIENIEITFYGFI